MPLALQCFVEETDLMSSQTYFILRHTSQAHNFRPINKRTKVEEEYKISMRSYRQEGMEKWIQRMYLRGQNTVSNTASKHFQHKLMGDINIERRG